MQGLRARKKLATRQMISDVATKLFMQRGFDQVTIEEVAEGAAVSKMTVLNYFGRKEDLLFDRDGEIQQRVATALTGRGKKSPLAALQLLAHQLIEDKHRLVVVTPGAAAFWKVVAESPTLRSRTRELNEELERDLSRMLAGPKPVDPVARLIAALLMGAWRVAFREALRRHRTASAAALRKVMTELLDRGFAAARAAARDTAYV